MTAHAISMRIVFDAALPSHYSSNASGTSSISDSLHLNSFEKVDTSPFLKIGKGGRNPLSRSDIGNNNMSFCMEWTI